MSKKKQGKLHESSASWCSRFSETRELERFLSAANHKLNRDGNDGNGKITVIGNAGFLTVAYYYL